VRKVVKSIVWQSLGLSKAGEIAMVYEDIRPNGMPRRQHFKTHPLRKDRHRRKKQSDQG
jgi:hypothetical protein